MSQYSQFSVSKVFGMPSIPEKVTAIGYADGSNPFIPATDTNYVFRKEFLREVLAYLKEPGGDALFVTGPRGCEEHHFKDKNAALRIGPGQPASCSP